MKNMNSKRESNTPPTHRRLLKLDKALEHFHEQIGEAPPHSQLELQKQYVYLNSLRQKVVKSLSLGHLGPDSSQVQRAEQALERFQAHLRQVLDRPLEQLEHS